MPLTLIGCGQTEPVRGSLPAECYEDTPHAALYAGQEARTALRLERVQLDAANASKARCSAFHDDLQAGGAA